jgi:formylglycine-generating enzyme required for sulfatase activity
VYDYPNGVSGYGTYNQSGNVLEWCYDWYDQDYYNYCIQNKIIHDPRGPDIGTYRVARGGSRTYKDANCFRATYRYWHDPNFCRDTLGFRIVLQL